MYVILKEQAAVYALEEEVVAVIRLADYSIPSGMLDSIFTEAGQLLGSDGLGSPVAITAPTAEGQILRARLAQTTKMAWEAVDLSPLVQPAVKTAAYTAVTNDHVLVDASGAGADFEIALPASPAAGTKVRATLVAEHATYKVTIGRNGSLVNGGTSTSALSLIKKGDSVYFEYTGATLGWVGILWNAGLLSWSGKTAPTGTVVGNTDTQTLTNKTLTSPVINTPTGIGKGDVGLGNVDNTSTATERAATATLTNKRINLRLTSEASSATPTINTDNTDVHTITALAVAITSFTTNLSGTPVEGQQLIIQITDNGTARAITWGASFAATTVALPTTTVISTRLRVQFLWNAVTSKWDCVGKA